MRKFLYIILIAAPGLYAQPAAPDFTVTDINGVSHTLYTDYLDQGKTVMLKLFYSTCPPCNAQAKNLQALYEDWGAGAHDVEFIEVSIRDWETDQTASSYTNNHGITFPTVSAQGGSLSVVNAYIGANFGAYTGTPTYIVIDPDGNVQWNVTFAGLDAAIASTGAQKPASASDDPVMQAHLWIAPNPAQNIAAVYSDGISEHSEVTVHIYNIVGQQIATIQGSSHTHPQIAGFDTQSWNSGTYLVRIEHDGRIVRTLRLVKN